MKETKNENLPMEETKMEKPVKKSSRTLSKSSNRELRIETDWFDNGDEKDFLFTNQRIILDAQGDTASINLYGLYLDSKTLREFADFLDEEKAKIIGTRTKKIK